MDTQLIIMWFSIIGIVVVAMAFRCIAKFNSCSNHYGVICYDMVEDAFEYDDDDNDDETVE